MSQRISQAMARMADATRAHGLGVIVSPETGMQQRVEHLESDLQREHERFAFAVIIAGIGWFSFIGLAIWVVCL